MSSAKRIATTLLTATGIAAAAAGGAQAAATDWQQNPVPVPSGNILAVTQVDQHTTWAAGFRLTTDGKADILNPLLLSRDDRTGGGWHQIATPADTANSRINALAADGSHDAWLVGDSDPGASAKLGTPILTEHWNGSAWQESYAPTPKNAFSAGFLGVTVLSPHDAWATGWAELETSSVPDPTTGLTQVTYSDVSLVEHWDGQEWRPASLPAGLPSADLTSVTSSGPHDVWAAGFTADGTDQPVLLHYDGKSWTRQEGLPKVGLYGEFNTIVAKGPHDIWAAGRAVLDDKDRGHPLVEHFDGRTWTAVTAPGTGTVFGATPTPGGVAVVGYDKASGQPYGERLDGTSWQSLNLPTVGDDTTPYAVAMTNKGLTVSGAYDVNGQNTFFPLILTDTK